MSLGVSRGLRSGSGGGGGGLGDGKGHSGCCDTDRDWVRNGDSDDGDLDNDGASDSLPVSEACTDMVEGNVSLLGLGKGACERRCNFEKSK